MASNALGNIYGAGEAFDLLRSPSSYGAEFRSNPLKGAVTRMARGMIDLRVSVEKSDGKTAQRGAASLARGLLALGGVPSDQAFQIAKGVRMYREPAGKAKKGKGGGSLMSASGDNDAAGARAVLALKARGTTLAQARIELRRQLVAAKATIQERVKRLSKLSARWRERAAA